MQESVAAPDRVALVHDKALTDGVSDAPIPLRLTTVESPVDELLVIVNLPDASPVALGANFTARLRLAPPFSVAGRLAGCAIEKKLPAIPTWDTWTGDVP